MPRGDGTGPMGMGAMTGRAAGYCAGREAPGFANSASGRGSRGRGIGFGGRGGRKGFNATGRPGRRFWGASTLPGGNLNPETEKQTLKQEADYFRNELDSIRKRLEEIDKGAGQQ